MKLLLDTHTFLWYVLNDAKLSATARGLIADPNNQKFLSPAGYWEIAIKISTGKYALPGPFDAFLTRQIQVNNFDVLHITVAHAARVATMLFHHRDPFDRLMIAQSLAEGYPLVSADPAFDAYGVTRLW